MAIEKVVRLEIQTKKAEDNLNKLNDSIQNQTVVVEDLEKKLKSLEKQSEQTPQKAFGAQYNLSQQINKTKTALEEQDGVLNNLWNQYDDATQAQDDYSKAVLLTSKQTQLLSTLFPQLRGHISTTTTIFNAASIGLSSFIKGLKGLKAALVSTGIGALVVALGLIVAYWDDIKTALTGVTKEMENQLRVSKALLDDAQDEYDNLVRNENVRRLAGETEEQILKTRIEANKKLAESKKLYLESQIAQKKAALETANTLRGYTKDIMTGITLPLSAILKAIDLANKAMGKASDHLGDFREMASGLIFDTKKQQEELDEFTKITKNEIEDLNNKIAGDQLSLNKINEDAPAKITQNKEQNNQKELQDREKLLQEIEALENEYLTSQLDKQTQEENAVREKYFAVIEAARQHAKDMGASQEEQNEAARLLEEAQKTELEEINEFYNERKAEKDAEFAEAEKMAKLELELLQMEEEGEIKLAKEIEIEEARRDALLANEDLTESQRALIIQQSLNKITGMKEDAAEADAEIERIKNEATIENISQTVESISSILGNQSKLGKAFAIASALINTYQGIMNVWAEKAESGLVGAGLIQRIATTAIVAAQGFKTVKNIAKVKTPGGGGGGGGGVSIPSAPSIPTASVSEPSAPQFDVNAGSVTNQLAGLGENQAPIQAFVVANNVTSAQSLDRNIIESASIG